MNDPDGGPMRALRLAPLRGVWWRGFLWPPSPVERRARKVPRRWWQWRG